MKRALLISLLALCACTPTLTEVADDPEPPVTFSCSGGECVITADAPIIEAYIGLEGAVESRYCLGAVTVQPRPCAPVVGEWRALDVPPGNYGRVLVVARIDKPPAGEKLQGFADVNLKNARESFRAELTP